MHLGLDGTLLKKRHAVRTEQFVVPHVLLCHIQTWQLINLLQQFYLIEAGVVPNCRTKSAVVYV